MTNQQHPDRFDWATELSDAQGHVTLSAQEAKEIGARLRRMGEKLKAYEDLDGAASDVQLLRTGYAAARLEIESLQARIKTMAEEHADELMVAHMDGRMRAAQQEAQEPVAWYVTGCSRLLDEDEAKAEARHIGGTARAIPLYTVPQADSVLEDAARLEFEMQHGSAIAAARKQGANHDQ